MTVPASPLVTKVEAPPIAEAMGWVRPGPRNRELLNLCQAVPSYPPAASLQAEFGRLANLPHMGGYTDSLGIPKLREAHARAIGADYGADIPASYVAMTSGCNQAFAAAVMAIAKAGDDVILPAPYYFNHQMWLTMLGITIKTIPAMTDTGNHPLASDVAAAIGPNTKAVVLCSPNNPTGAIYPPQVLREIFDVARERGLALIIDETYKDFRPGVERVHGLFGIPGWDQTLLQLYSYSKVYALAGYRLGAIIGNPAILSEIVKVLDCMTICPATITQEGVVFALQELDAWKSEKLALMATRLEGLRNAFRHPGLRYALASSGAYFAYVRHPFRGETAKAVAMRLAAENDVLCLPGSMFGPGQEDYLRFAFANVDAELMEPLVERLIESQR